MITIGYVSSLIDPIVTEPLEEDPKRGFDALRVYTVRAYEVAHILDKCIVLRLKDTRQQSTKLLVFHGPSDEMQPLLAHAKMLLERSAHVH